MTLFKMHLQKQQLLNLNVPELFMNVSLDDGTTPPIKCQYPELSKLYAVVSQLVRCCDISAKCLSSSVSVVASILLVLDAAAARSVY